MLLLDFISLLLPIVQHCFPRDDELLVGAGGQLDGEQLDGEQLAGAGWQQSATAAPRNTAPTAPSADFCTRALEKLARGDFSSRAAANAGEDFRNTSEDSGDDFLLADRELLRAFLATTAQTFLRKDDNNWHQDDNNWRRKCDLAESLIEILAVEPVLVVELRFPAGVTGTAGDVVRTMTIGQVMKKLANALAESGGALTPPQRTPPPGRRSVAVEDTDVEGRRSAGPPSGGSPSALILALQHANWRAVTKRNDVVFERGKEPRHRLALDGAIFESGVEDEDIRKRFFNNGSSDSAAMGSGTRTPGVGHQETISHQSQRASRTPTAAVPASDSTDPLTAWLDQYVLLTFFTRAQL